MESVYHQHQTVMEIEVIALVCIPKLTAPNHLNKRPKAPGIKKQLIHVYFSGCLCAYICGAARELNHCLYVQELVTT